MRCSIVIPVHGAADLALRAIGFIRSNPPQIEHEIVVVDDGSPGGVDPRLQCLSGVRVVELSANRAFAGACNAAALRCHGEWLIFLNDDTEPEPGWLDALVGHAEAHEPVGAVGARLLYPGGVVQHAGVVFGRDGLPHHVYQGFPAAHPAVSKPRRFQAVTAACMLVRRETFLTMGGFDEAYRNGMEDVDLCLRMGEAGLDVWYCPEAALTHLESVTRGRGTPDVRRGTRRFREQWGSRVRADDLELYAADGLLTFEYREGQRHRVSVAPALAASHADPSALERELGARTRQATDLLRDLTELLARTGGASAHLRSAPSGPSSPTENSAAGETPDASFDTYPNHRSVTEKLDRLILDLQALQAEVGQLTVAGQYRARVEQIRRILVAGLPEGATVAVVSRGDEALLDVPGRLARHFPSDSEGQFAGHYPASAADAIAHLEDQRRCGAEFLAVPSDGAWWLEHYVEFGTHLQMFYRSLAVDEALQLFDLRQREEAHVPV